MYCRIVAKKRMTYGDLQVFLKKCYHIQRRKWLLQQDTSSDSDLPTHGIIAGLTTNVVGIVKRLIAIGKLFRTR